MPPTKPPSPPFSRAASPSPASGRPWPTPYTGMWPLRNPGSMIYLRPIAKPGPRLRASYRLNDRGFSVLIFLNASGPRPVLFPAPFSHAPAYPEILPHPDRSARGLQPDDYRPRVGALPRREMAGAGDREIRHLVWEAALEKEDRRRRVLLWHHSLR